MSELENALLGLETSLDNINETLESNTEYLKMISRELLISNLPENIRLDQRKLFTNIDLLEIYNSHRSTYLRALGVDPEGPASDGFKEDIKKYSELINKYEKENDEYYRKGCV